MKTSSSQSSLRSLVASLPWRLPQLLLIAVALVQIALAQSGELLAWKGGGFGMFARLDGVGFREIRVLGAENAPVEIPSELYALERRCQIYPNDACLDALAKAMEVAGPGPRRISVWRARFEGSPLRPTWERIAGWTRETEQQREP